jgi:glucokinase
VSTGVVLDGRVLRGANGLAGEIGHVNAEPGGAPCACGLRGCLEVVAAGPHIARLAREAVATGRPTALPSEPTAADVFAAAAAGDALAQQLAAAVAERLARAIRALVLTLGVNHIVIGGGVAAAGAALLGPVLAAIDAERVASPLVDAAFREANVELLSPQAEAGARGAAQIARERISARQQKGVGKR